MQTIIRQIHVWGLVSIPWLTKVTKTKAAWPTEDVLVKALYLGICSLTKKWTGKIQGWGQILDQLRIYFDGRILEGDLA